MEGEDVCEEIKIKKEKRRRYRCRLYDRNIPWFVCIYYYLPVFMDGVLYVNSQRLQLLQVYLRQLIAAAGAKEA